jgi:FKBP12-rapamycin complex-associated protein
LQHYEEVCELVLFYREHKDRLIRRVVIELIPVLAHFDPDHFLRNTLNQALKHILSVLKTGHMEEKAAGFLALGETAKAMGDRSIGLLADVPLIVDALKEHLSSRRNKNSEALLCIAALSQAVGDTLEPYLNPLLELMFAGGLSPELTTALKGVVEHIPSKLVPIQEELLNVLSTVLTGSPYRKPGAPSVQPSHRRTGTMAKDTQNPSLEAKPDSEVILLALNTFGTFNFEGHNLVDFVRSTIATYLDDDNPDVRKEAARTCCKVLLPSSTNLSLPKRSHSSLLVGEVLSRLLTVGVADPDPSVRKTVLQSLDFRFDPYLAQAAAIRSLFIALNDEAYEIREEVILIIGRLTLRNPAYVMPSLRKALIQLLTELNYSGDARRKEESARLLGQLVRASKSLIQPYVSPILQSLVPKLKDPHPGVCACVLNTLGLLARVGGAEMTQRTGELMPLIVDMLQDQSSLPKREAALCSLSELAESTGYVIQPYHDYPALLPILLNLLKTEQSTQVRCHVIKALGVLGALDPYRHKEIQQKQLGVVAKDNRAEGTDKGQNSDYPTLAPSSKDYYPTVAINALMKILRDPTLGVHHQMVIQAVMFIFKSLGLKCVPYLDQVVPPFLQVIRNTDPSQREFFLGQLGALISIVKQHIRKFLDQIFGLIEENWHHSSMVLHNITLIEHICQALQDEFKIYLPNLISPLLDVLHSETPERTLKVLNALRTFGNNLQDYLYLVMPAVVNLSKNPEIALPVRIASVNLIVHLCSSLDFSDLASRVIHPMAQILDNGPVDLREPALMCLCNLATQLGQDYAIFVPMTLKILKKNHIQHARYEAIANQIASNEAPSFGGVQLDSADGQKETPSDSPRTSVSLNNVPDDVPASGDTRRMHVNQQQLKKAWEASQRSTKDDWNEWMRRFNVELLKESPSPALRSCFALAQVYHNLARELFNAAFVSCWNELFAPNQDSLVRELETVLSAPNIPPEILQQLLNLAEFMEHDEKGLPIESRTLSALAENCHAYAKALHYKELEFHSNPTAAIESLISINSHLGQHESALGILTYAQRQHRIELNESWYEKLQQWDKALEVYERKALDDPVNMEVTLARLRCYHALGHWSHQHSLSIDVWPSATPHQRKRIAPLMAWACLHLMDWDSLSRAVETMSTNSYEKSFFSAITSIRQDHFEVAQQQIDKCRQIVDTDLTALVGESYNRAYMKMVNVMQLAELEEVMLFKQSAHDPTRQEAIHRMWNERLNGCQRDVEVWMSVLSIRWLVMKPRADIPTYLKLTSICRQHHVSQLYFIV